MASCPKGRLSAVSCTKTLEPRQSTRPKQFLICEALLAKGVPRCPELKSWGKIVTLRGIYGFAREFKPRCSHRTLRNRYGLGRFPKSGPTSTSAGAAISGLGHTPGAPRGSHHSGRIACQNLADRH